MSDPIVTLDGQLGNNVVVIHKVEQALRENNREDEANEYRQKAFRRGSIDALLDLSCHYVDVPDCTRVKKRIAKERYDNKMPEHLEFKGDK